MANLIIIRVLSSRKNETIYRIEILLLIYFLSLRFIFVYDFENKLLLQNEIKNYI